MKQLITLTLLLVALGCKAYGQYVPLGAISSWTEGYVITTANDTIAGQIRISMLINDAPASVVIKTHDGQKQTIKAENLLQIAQRIPDFAYATGHIPRERHYIVVVMKTGLAEGPDDVLRKAVVSAGLHSGGPARCRAQFR